MKKIIKSIMIISFLFVCIIGCSKQEEKSQNVINDKTITIQSFDEKDYSHVIDTKSILDFSKIYNDIDDLYADAKNIVYGKVVSTENFDESGAANTKYDFIIEKVYKGNLSPNDKISILGIGGYMRLEKEIEIFGKGKFEDYSTEQIKNTVLVDIPMGVDLPKIDDKYLVFLTNPLENEPPFPDGIYDEIGAFMGRFVEKSNHFERVQPKSDPNFYKEKDKVYEMKEIEKNLESLEKDNK